jgi:hypothetical protein
MAAKLCDISTAIHHFLGNNCTQSISITTRQGQGEQLSSFYELSGNDDMATDLFPTTDDHPYLTTMCLVLMSLLAPVAGVLSSLTNNWFSSSANIAMT